MPWTVKAFASDATGREFKVVAETDDDESPEDIMWAIPYWVKAMEVGEKVVIERV